MTDPWSFPNPHPAFSNAALQYSERKLAHYNKWLLDPKRDIGKPYPGFPEDLATVVKQPVAVQPTKPAEVKPVRAKRVKPPARTGSKLEQAVAIYRRVNGDKASVIAAIQQECGMSVAGATTYYYNARKAVNA